MAASPASFLKSAAHQTPAHTHSADHEVCPVCEQPIPHDHFDEINKRIEQRQREQASEVAAQLQEQFAREKAQVLAQAQREAAAVLERERESAKVSTKAQLDQVRSESEAAIERLKQEAVAKEVKIRAEAAHSAQTTMQAKLAELEQTRLKSEALLQARIEHAESVSTAAEGARSDLLLRIEKMQRDNDEAVQKIKQDAAIRENAIRQEATTAAEATVQEKIADIDQARINAEAKVAGAEQQVRALQEAHEAQLSSRLQEQREALERAQVDAVNAEKSAAFQERLKLSAKVEELQRAVDKKSAEELGEGAEIDLFESLKAEFEGDRIERVNRGQPGADILHTVMHKGKECGKIIYDSKNHNAWRNDFVTKLATDQMAAKAEHAILSTRKFPAGAHHLHVQDGVLLASPSRVVALVQIVRQHLIQTHTLRMSNEARTQKTAALYTFITSERCADLFVRIDTHAEDLLEVQLKEKKTHEATWKRQGELIRSVQKVRAELCNEIEVIIGTGEAAEKGE